MFDTLLKKVTAGAVLVGLLAYGITGFYSVEPDESAVAFFLGSVSEGELGPGVHWNFPWPFGRQIVAQTKTNLLMSIGGKPIGDRQSSSNDVSFNSNNQWRNEPVTYSDINLWMTGGASLVRIRLDIQYTISQLDLFALSHNNPTDYLRAVAEKALTRFLIANQVDDVLTTGRQFLRGELQQQIQQELDAASTGIRVQDVIIVELAPPHQGSVARAFQDVQSARSDRDRVIEDAHSRRSQLLFNANARADGIRNTGQSDRFARIEKARGAASRFQALAKEYASAPDITTGRIYLERMSEVLERARLYIVPDKADESSINLVPNK